MNSMFRIVSIIGFIITFVGIGFHYVVLRPPSGDLVRTKQRLRRQGILGILDILKKLVCLLTLLCFVVLAVNGFYPSLILGKPISGYWLMLQVTAGVVFACCLAVLTLMWAHHYRFNENDWQRLQHLLRRETASKKLPSERFRLGQKIAFWLIVLLALPVILSIVLSMFTLFGTGAQEFLLQLHRYSVLLLALFAIVHTYLVILTGMRK